MRQHVRDELHVVVSLRNCLSAQDFLEMFFLKILKALYKIPQALQLQGLYVERRTYEETFPNRTPIIHGAGNYLSILPFERIALLCFQFTPNEIGLGGRLRLRRGWVAQPFPSSY